MATLTIQDSLFQDYIAALKSRGISDVDSQINGLIRADLVREVAPEADRDGLTGCGTRHSLALDINRAAWGGNSLDDTIYEGAFLCIDIDNFQAFLDHNGYGPSDEVLRRLASSLIADYSQKSVYRFGGDEFVVNLGGAKPKPLPKVADITLKYTRVDVRVTRNRKRNHHATRWIAFHLDRGIVEARPEGHTIACGDPPYLAQQPARAR